ncbi:MAG: glycosyltransferase family 4 protein [Methanomicrobiales archaeon]
MSIYNTAIYIFILTLVASIFFTAFVRKVLKNAGITDNPIVTEHQHKAGTPTMGGMAILLSILLISCIYFGNKNLIITCMMMLTAGIVGMMDDLIGLKTKEVQDIIKNIHTAPIKIGKLTLKIGEEARVATEKAKEDLNNFLAEKKVKIIGKAPIKNEVEEKEKIFAQFLIALFLIVSGTVSYTLGGVNWGIFVIPLAIFGIIGAINAVNLIDGMDGLAAGIMAIASAACAIILLLGGNIAFATPFIAISGICCGFLVFNKYPASIFMGDTGSFALGAGYATAAILGDIIYFAAIALAVPIISVIISLLHRSNIIKLPVEPLHHTLHYKGFSEKKIIAIYWISTLIICIFLILFYRFF